MRRKRFGVRAALAGLLISSFLLPTGWNASVDSQPLQRNQITEGRECSPASQVMTIGFGELVICHINPVGDTDDFQFSAEAGDVVGIRIAHLGGLGKEVGYLLNAEGHQIGSAGKQIDARLEKTGVYTIRISGVGPGTLRYALSLERLASPSPSATPLSSGHGLLRWIDPGGDVDLYFFRAAPGDRVSIAVARRGGLGLPVADLSDPDGQPIGQVGGRIDAALEKAGLYAVRVYSSTEYHKFSYTIHFWCQGQCPPAEESRSVFILPFVVAGRAKEGIWQTAVICANLSKSPVTGTLNLVQPDGRAPLQVTVGGTTGSKFPLSVPAGGMKILEIQSPTAFVQGLAKLVLDKPIRVEAAIRAVAEAPSDDVLCEMSYNAPTPTKTVTILAERSGKEAEVGLVLFNPNASRSANLTLRLLHQSGKQVAETTLSVGPGQLSKGSSGNIIRFVSKDIFAKVPDIAEFRGTIVISSPLDVSVLALQKRGQRLTLLPMF